MATAQSRKFEHHARDAVVRLLSRDLVLPTIYFDTRWPNDENGIPIDIVAFDRAGGGEVHLIEVVHRIADARQVAARLMHAPGHFKWIAFDSTNVEPDDLALLMDEDWLYSTDAMGKIGLIEVFPMQAGRESGARVYSRALTFKTALKRLANQFKRSNEAAIDPNT